MQFFGIFCCLLLHRDHPLPREILASPLWPGTTNSQSKKYMYLTMLDKTPGTTGQVVTSSLH
jgi:DNA-binding SARP family transcriptional activator